MPIQKLTFFIVACKKKKKKKMENRKDTTTVHSEAPMLLMIVESNNMDTAKEANGDEFRPPFLQIRESSIFPLRRSIEKNESFSCHLKVSIKFLSVVLDSNIVKSFKSGKSTSIRNNY